MFLKISRDECSSELDYIGEYIRDFVDVKDIAPDQTKEIVSCLERYRNEKVHLSVTDDLLKKLTAT
ncbi:hypothetical protein KIN20_022618 [Parelaphostrongylus tenuis]|uniref:Uncharacterized protein n=1 Tax=Parelaphostrongylus tenuis TaxID=148309 RepID=A0AAD5N977_PARTN|nr:hypothetical protein KIN20_022618 [Parelaphostrongylus tenuis]